MPTVGTLVSRRLTQQRDALHAAEATVRDGEPTGVHDLRVAMRRIRSLLATYRPVFDTTVTEPMHHELKAAAARLGQSRDAEVATDSTDDLLDDARLTGLGSLGGPVGLSVLDGLGGLEGEAVTGLRARLRLDAVAAEDVVEETLDSRGYAALLAALDDMVGHPPLTDKAGRRAQHFARKRLRHEGRRFVARAEAARVAVDPTDPDAPHDEDEHGDRLHELRKAAKRLRYAAETADPVTGKGVARVGAGAKHVQSALGSHHDAVMTRATLRHLALDEAVGEAAAFLLGHLDADEQRIMSGLEKEAWRAVDDLEDLLEPRL